jgi:hypothetical protein
MKAFIYFGHLILYMSLLNAILGGPSGTNELREAGVDLGYTSPPEQVFSLVDEIPLTGASIDSIAVEMYGHFQQFNVKLPLALHNQVVRGYHDTFGDSTLGDIKEFYRTNLLEFFETANIDFLQRDGVDVVAQYFKEYDVTGPNRTFGEVFQAKTGYFFGYDN